MPKAHPGRPLVMALTSGLVLAASAAGEETIDAGGHWKYVVSEGGATLTGFEEKAGHVLVVSGELDGYPVTGIGEGVFRDLDLIDVTLPDSVTSIDDFVFADGYMQLVRIPESVTYISLSAFEGGGITVLMLPEGGYAEAYADEAEIPYFYDDEEDDLATWVWTYDLEDDGATITGYPTVTGWEAMPIGAPTIPDTVDGHPVTAIGKMAFTLHEMDGAWGLPLRVPKDSYAERYAREHGISCVFIE